MKWCFRFMLGTLLLSNGVTAQAQYQATMYQSGGNSEQVIILPLTTQQTPAQPPRPVAQPAVGQMMTVPIIQLQEMPSPYQPVVGQTPPPVGSAPAGRMMTVPIIQLQEMPSMSPPPVAPAFRPAVLPAPVGRVTALPVALQGPMLPPPISTAGSVPSGQGTTLPVAWQQRPILGTPGSSPILLVQGNGASNAASNGGGGGGAAPDTGTTAQAGTGESNIDTRPSVENPTEDGLGPTPLTKVNILNELLWGEDYKKACIQAHAWADMDYTYRSTGRGINNVAPVMNRFGDEFLFRELGIWLYKPLDPKECSWGFNIIFIGGSDASFLTPTRGGWRNPDPRFGSSFTDLNLTAHLPILTEGGVDIKAGRQTTVLGPMGALSWQRIFNSSDYAWYNLEEGRYTGVSALWHITKQLDWYNGIEFGWGTFFAQLGPAPQYITQISYWLDEEAKKTKVWTTCLTGPTGRFNTGNTTVTEFGLLHNYNKYWYQIVDTQLLYSKAPVFQAVPKGYQQRAYDLYTYVGCHLNEVLDLNGRIEWYKDVDGGFYPGGFGVPHTSYYEGTVGFDYHPCKWIQFRPELRYDYATNPNFGRLNDKKNQLTLSGDLMFKF